MWEGRNDESKKRRIRELSIVNGQGSATNNQSPDTVSSLTLTTNKKEGKQINPQTNYFSVLSANSAVNVNLTVTGNRKTGS